MKGFGEVEEELRRIVGPDNVSTDPETLKTYSKDQSFVRACMPDFVVFARSVKEVQEVVRTANKHSVPVIPYSSGMNLHGATIPSQGGIILNLSKMNKIMEINEQEGWVSMEAGVTYAQLQDELEKHGLRIMIPFATLPSRSAVSSIVEGEPTIAAASFEYGNAIHMDMEIVLPTGEVLRWGKWRLLTDDEWNPPAGGGITGEKYMYETLWYGAQGTLGIVTKLVAKVEHLSKVNRVFFIPFDRLEDAIEPIRRIQRRELGLESLMLNSFNLAAIVAGEWTVPERLPCEKVASTEFDALRGRLPRWTFMIHLSGLPHLPEEKVAYEEEDLREVCEELNVAPLSTVAGVEGLEDIILDGMLHPWQFLKKAHYKGSFCDVALYTKLGSVPKLERVIHELAERYGYPAEDIGGYILPIERARSCYCEFDFHCDLGNVDETERVKKLWLEVHEALADRGVVLAKPYGPVADIIYRRVDPVYVAKLKELKRELDPNNVMNPGKLCF
jgi:FAD/FMN-containing dehydrogenase